MPTIYDNLSPNTTLLQGLEGVLKHKGLKSVSICVGYFHLRSWDKLASYIDKLSGKGDEVCRILVGMHRPPQEVLRQLQGLSSETDGPIDGPTLARLRQEIVESFQRQLTFGIPSTKAQDTLAKLLEQIEAGKVLIRAFLQYPLHAKLYLIQRSDSITPLIGFIGSSNLTVPGLEEQGELNIDVTDQDAARKLQKWFENRWQQATTIDLTKDLTDLLKKSWIRHQEVKPYWIYLKIAYYLSEEARQSQREIKIPSIFAEKGTLLLDFQAHAVALAVKYLYRWDGVLLGDVVGLGKTLMATAIARLLQEDEGYNTLILCPPKLVPMWEYYKDTYQLVGRVVSIGEVESKLPSLTRHRLVIIDESHNLRNPEGKRYKAIQAYIEQNESRVLLLTATPYNKHYTDLSAQLRLFLDPDRNLGMRPERLYQELDKKRKAGQSVEYPKNPTALVAFEKSPYADDWRDLMRLFLVRRTRSFIMQHYAQKDPQKKRYFLLLHDNQRRYFPIRKPVSIEVQPDPQYTKLMNEKVVDILGNLRLPRYGLGAYIDENSKKEIRTTEKAILDNLTRAGRRLVGFARTNLFKRLESSGYSFLLSIQRHILRNCVFLYAIQAGKSLPIGSQDPALLDPGLRDTELPFEEAEEEDSKNPAQNATQTPCTLTDLPAIYSLEEGIKQAEKVYQSYLSASKRQFKWISSHFFTADLRKHLEEDTKALLSILQKAGKWKSEQDSKLEALWGILQKHSKDKFLIFTQFADTACYLWRELRRRGDQAIEVITSETENPTAIVRRFSPKSNGGLPKGESEVRILIATDVLAEGQNLQDCHIIINYDLPWAIIRLIQRAGRVDRIGQEHETIYVYSFLPEGGLEERIRLQRRLLQRLQANQEIIGTDEAFFDETVQKRFRDLYAGKEEVLQEEEAEEDIDIASLALQVWNSASQDERQKALDLPLIAAGTKPVSSPEEKAGVITYVRFSDGTDALIQVDEGGNLVSQSLSAVFRAAACDPKTPTALRLSNHHQLVEKAVAHAMEERRFQAGALGTRRSIPRQVYDQLSAYLQRVQQDSRLLPAGLSLDDIKRVRDLIYQYPLREAAREALGRQLRLGIPDSDLAEMAVRLANEQKLCLVSNAPDQPLETQIICSLGLRK